MKNLMNKRTFNKLLATIIIALLCVSICSPAFAVSDTNTTNNSDYIGYDDIDTNVTETTSDETVTVEPTTDNVVTEDTTVTEAETIKEAETQETTVNSNDDTVATETYSTDFTTEPTEAVINTSDSTDETTIATEITTATTIEVTEITEATETTETVETTTYETTPVVEDKTTVKVTTSKKTLYVTDTYIIKPTVENGKGTTTYQSDNKSVATVNGNGKVTANKAGTAKITVRNNYVKVVVTITVKNPKLNITKKTLKLKKTYKYNKSFNLAITGEVGKAKFSSSNKKVATVNQGGKVTAKKVGKTTITVKTNGIRLTCKVTVKKLTTLEKLINSGDLKVTCKLKKDSITRNIGTTAQAKNLYTISDNAYKLVKQSKAELASPFVIKNEKQLITSKQYEKISKTINRVTYSIDDTKIATVSKNGKITPKAKGTTTLKIKTFKDTWKIKVTVKKKVNITFNGKKAIGVYSVKEAYNYLKDAFYNHIIKGEMPEWRYLMCYFDVKDGSDENSTTTQYMLKQLAYKEIDTGNNFFHYLTPNSYGMGEVWMPYAFVSNQTNPYVIEIFWGDNEGENKCEKQMLNYYKKLYIAAQKAFDEMNISECKNDYEKVIAIGNWLHKYDGDTSTYVPEMDETFEGSIIINHIKNTTAGGGYCQNWTWTTQYLLTLQNVPCNFVDSATHMWNLVKYNGKWYHLDIYWNLYFLGNDDITQDDCYGKTSKNAHKIEVVYEPLTIDLIEDKSLVI
jgi:hypothetical protein